MAWISPVLMAAGTVMSAAGQQQSAAAEAQAARYNSAITQAEAQAEEERIRRETQQQIGQTRASIAKSGVTYEGTPLLVLGETAANAEIDILNTQWSADTASKLYGMRASSATQAGNIGAGTSLLSGASKMF
jgi:regulator of protease activity HflC (stomatin/prohibitin superfamily)